MQSHLLQFYIKCVRLGKKNRRRRYRDVYMQIKYGLSRTLYYTTVNEIIENRKFLETMTSRQTKVSL